MKKASQVILGGLVGVVGAGAGALQAGAPPPFVDPGDFDLNVVCKPDGSAEFEGSDGCIYEVSWRCDGEYAEAALDDYGIYGYGICIAGSFVGDEPFMAASWAAQTIDSIEGRGECEDTDYGFYGWFWGQGPEGTPIGINGFEVTLLEKMEGKWTTADRGNGKPAGHPGRKDDADNSITVEIEFKRKSCD